MAVVDHFIGAMLITFLLEFVLLAIWYVRRMDKQMRDVMTSEEE